MERGGGGWKPEIRGEEGKAEREPVFVGTAKEKEDN